MSNFKPSAYQEAIFTFIKEGKGNAVVNAVAGSGKTSTLVKALEHIPSTEPVLFLAFNKSIVDELQSRVMMMSNVTVKTLHSHGFAALRKAYGSEVDAQKYTRELNERIERGTAKPNSGLDFSDSVEWKSNIKKLVDLLRVNMCSSVDEIESIAAKHGLMLLDNEITVAADLVRWGYKLTERVDFTDMIYLAAKKNIWVDKFNWVFVDECQDLNAAQRHLFLKSLEPTGRFLAVGDPRQAIYGFAGADAESFRLMTVLDNTQTLPLSVCYRCDSKIIEAARSEVPYIECRDGAGEGVVDIDADAGDIQDGDLVICRLNAPLVKACLEFLAIGRKAYIKGVDIGENLIYEIKRMRASTVVQLIKALDSEKEKMIFKLTHVGGMSEDDALGSTAHRSYSDKVEAIKVLSFGHESPVDIINKIRSIFADDSRAGVCFSTIHKSKGLESERVFIISPEMLLFHRAMQIDWMAAQEHNLVYVAITRAKHHLGFIAS